jgi:hypothetical protein
MGSGFAVILAAEKKTWKRSFAYGNDPVNIADLNAVKFALLSIARPFWAASDNKLVIHTKSRYVASMMEKDDDGFYMKLAEANADLINEIRDLAEERGASIVKSDPDTEMSAEVKNLVVDAVKNGVVVDNRC